MDDFLLFPCGQNGTVCLGGEVISAFGLFIEVSYAVIRDDKFMSKICFVEQLNRQIDIANIIRETVTQNTHNMITMKVFYMTK